MCTWYNVYVVKSEEACSYILQCIIKSNGLLIACKIHVMHKYLQTWYI